MKIRHGENHQARCWHIIIRERRMLGLGRKKGVGDSLTCTFPRKIRWGLWVQACIACFLGRSILRCFGLAEP
jgi:hypothetical protein